MLFTVENMASRKADEFRENMEVSSNLHYYVQKQVQLLSLLARNKCIALLVKVKSKAIPVTSHRDP
jgi:hypothetical protein